MILTIRNTTLKDLVYFYQNVRVLDKVETGLMSELRLADTSINDLADSQVLVDEDDNVYALGGINGKCIWLLCTHKVEENPITFLRYCRRYFDSWLRGRVVTNFAWLGNRLHIEWLKWVGAVFVGKSLNNFQQFIIDSRKESDTNV